MNQTIVDDEFLAAVEEARAFISQQAEYCLEKTKVALYSRAYRREMVSEARRLADLAERLSRGTK